jgi:hypothetical protein
MVLRQITWHPESVLFATCHITHFQVLGSASYLTSAVYFYHPLCPKGRYAPHVECGENEDGTEKPPYVAALTIDLGGWKMNFENTK